MLDEHMDHEAATTRAQDLPAGCAVGVVVAASSVATPVPEGAERFFLAMQFAYGDDYHALMELARAGCAEDALHPKNLCGFVLRLRPEDRPDYPRTLKVCSANLLHYAVAIGSYRAAAALLIIEPRLMSVQCIVAHDEEASDQKEVWTALDLARLFADLYADGETDDVVEAETKFSSILRVLQACTFCPQSMPFINLPTAMDRVAAAGGDPDAACSALIRAAWVAA
jgi:hypothetical protein